jgi:hypothetical protein
MVLHREKPAIIKTKTSIIRLRSTAMDESEIVEECQSQRKEETYDSKSNSLF